MSVLRVEGLAASCRVSGAAVAAAAAAAAAGVAAAGGDGRLRMKTRVTGVIAT